MKRLQTQEYQLMRLMDTKFCNACKEAIEEEQESFEYPEESGYYYCAACADEMKNTCPRCGGHGCNFCLMLDW